MIYNKFHFKGIYLLEYAEQTMIKLYILNTGAIIKTQQYIKQSLPNIQ